MSFDLKSALGSIAPVLASMLGGPLAGTAVTALEGAFGLTPGSGQDGITQVVQSGGMTPDVIAKVREADQKHAEIMSQQGIDVQKLNLDFQQAQAATEVADRDSARKRETSTGDYTTRVLAYIVVCGGGGMLAAVLAGWAHADSVLAGTLVGYAVSEMKQVLSYYFGSSIGSSEKTAIMAQQIKDAQK